ncbi:MAG: GTP-binding protein [Gemmatimonadales bacterium]
MRVYGSSAIRNVAIVGHGAAGKTTLVDALAFVADSTKRHGTIPEGTTLTDCSPDEIERKHSISLDLAFAEWADTKINLLDAPGFLDFLGEATAALHSAAAAVVVLNATGGVEVGTEKVWEICDRLHLPRLLFVGQMDRERADFEPVFHDVRTHLSPKVVPVELPIGNGADFHGVVNLLTDETLTYRTRTKTGEYDTVPLPDDVKATYAKYRERLVESNFPAECFDGSSHDVDSNEMSFRMARIQAFRTVAPKAQPVLLEPLLDVTVWVPGETMGDVIGDPSARRGQILSTGQDGRLTRIKVIVPESEIYKYATTLHSITHGRGTFHQDPRGYAEAPPEVTARIAAEHRKDDGDEGSRRRGGPAIRRDMFGAWAESA